jgi:hypothetical protein
LKFTGDHRFDDDVCLLGVELARLPVAVLTR